VANCGISHSDIEPLSTMNRWVQSALDAIEYANGPVTSTWGKRRAENGHPAPFNLKYIEIGNENGAGWSFGGPAAYAERYPLLLNAIKAKYPDVVCIADNPVPHPMEVIDEHYYATPAWFWSQKDRYDRYDRKGPKIYVGEYAVTQDCGLGNLKAALGEAAFMVGMERNSDIVTMSSYAPLLVNVNEKQWNPNAIVFNASQSFGTPSYHVQALFAQNRPDQMVHSTYKATAAPYRISGGVGVGTWETKAEFRNLRLSVNGQDVPVGDLRFPSDDWSRADGVIRQASELRDRTAVSVAHPLDGAARYVYQLQARKVSGREGFIIPFGTGGDHALQLNLGGWGNVKHAVQAVDGAGIVSREVPGKIETNRWYDIRIEVEGPQVRTFLDGSPLISYTDPLISRFALNAGTTRGNRELIVKCINGEDEARTANVNLTSGNWEPTARAIVMTSGHVNDENTFESPRKIAPRSYTIRNVRSSFPLVVPARSVLILRLRRQP
jgi:alpha-L-arabinofuranosidase